jgi:hypothetical protein
MNSARLTTGEPRAVTIFANFERQVSALVAAGKHVYIIMSNPTVQRHIPGSNIPKRLGGFVVNSTIPEISKQEFLEETWWVSAQLRRIGERTGATLIDPVDYLCDDTKCRTMTAEGMPMYKDADHLRAGYVRDSVGWIDEIFQR